MAEPLGITCSILTLVGIVTKAIGKVDMAIAAHEDHRRGLRNLQHELHKTYDETANIRTLLRVMFGDPQDSVVKQLCKDQDCLGAIRQLTRALEDTQVFITDHVVSEGVTRIEPNYELLESRKSFASVQAVLKHSISPSTLNDAIATLEELKFQVIKHREEIEIAFQFLHRLYDVQRHRIIQKGSGDVNIASVSIVAAVISSPNCIEDKATTPADGNEGHSSSLQKQSCQVALHRPIPSPRPLGPVEDTAQPDYEAYGSETSSLTTVVVPPSTPSEVRPAQIPPKTAQLGDYNGSRGQSVQESFPHLESIMDIMGVILADAKYICCAIDKALALTLDQRQGLKDLRKAIENIKADTKDYKILTTAMKNDSIHGCSPFAIFIHQKDGKEAVKDLVESLKATQALLHDHPRHDTRPGATGRKQLQGTLNLVFATLKTNLKSGQRLEPIGDLKDVTSEVQLRQQKNERAFKLVWNLYVIAQQRTVRRPSIDNVGQIQDQVGQAHDAILHAFSHSPFAISLEGDSRLSLTVLNHSHNTAAHYQELARQIGKAWVVDQLPRGHIHARDIEFLKTSFFDIVWSGMIEQLKSHSAYPSGDPEQAEFQLKSVELERGLQKAIMRSRKPTFTIAFCGMVKAGKSLFLNALMGRGILPSDELPSTAWPCRLRHVEGQKEPTLQFNAEPFLAALKELQEYQYGHKMKNYQPPPKDALESLLLEAPPEPPEEVKLGMIHLQWMDLHSVTRENLLKFEDPSFELPRVASGEEAVKKLLGQLNDIFRLCQRFDIQFDLTKPEWPLLKVEFKLLRGHQINSECEFIDLPGVGEDFRSPIFEKLVRLGILEVDAIVPIVSFKELARSDWRWLQRIIEGGSNRSADLSICTHLDQVSEGNIKEQLLMVAKTFWPKSALTTQRVIPCSPLMGLSARELLDMSDPVKPAFEKIWRTNVMGYQCAMKLLGLANAETNYSAIGERDWQDQLRAQLEGSGLRQAIEKVTGEMVDSARKDAFISEADSIIRKLKTMSNIVGRKLLEARRTRDDFDAAKESYDRARYQLEGILNTWNREQDSQIQENRKLLTQASDIIAQKAHKSIGQAIVKTLQNWELGDIELVDGDTTSTAGAASEARAKVLSVKNVAHVVEFLRRSQQELHSSLNFLKLEYVAAVRKLAEFASEKRFRVLRGAIKDLSSQLQPEVWSDIDGDLESQSIDIREVAFQRIRSMIKVTSTRSTLQTAFRTIETKLARSWLGSSTSDGNPEMKDDIEGAVQKSIDELGFMLRAPIAILATLPFIFGLPFWFTQSRSYHLGIDVICNRYEDEIVDPWITSLKGEGETTLMGTIEISSKVAKDLVTSALEREDNRYTRELEGKSKPPIHPAKLQRLVATYGNFVAAEEALRHLADCAMRLSDDATVDSKVSSI